MTLQYDTKRAFSAILYKSMEIFFQLEEQDFM